MNNEEVLMNAYLHHFGIHAGSDRQETFKMLQNLGFRTIEGNSADWAFPGLLEIVGNKKPSPGHHLAFGFRTITDFNTSVERLSSNGTEIFEQGRVDKLDLKVVWFKTPHGEDHLIWRVQDPVFANSKIFARLAHVALYPSTEEFQTYVSLYEALGFKSNDGNEHYLRLRSQNGEPDIHLMRSNDEYRSKFHLGLQPVDMEDTITHLEGQGVRVYRTGKENSYGDNARMFFDPLGVKVSLLP